MTQENAFFIGIDRSDRHLDFCLLDKGGAVIRCGQIGSDPAALHLWMDGLLKEAEGQPLLVAFEQPAPNLLAFFTQFAEVRIYPLNPAAVRSYCRSFAISNAHSDRTDAAMIARYLFHYHGTLRSLAAASGPLRRLRVLVEHRRELVDERTALTNKLQALLKLYYPQALELLSQELWREMDCAFLLRYPSWQALKRVRPATLQAFWRSQGSRSEKLIARRLEAVKSGRALSEDPDLIEPLILKVRTVVECLQLLAVQLRRAQAEIERVAATFNDYAFFQALPGAGPAFAPRLLAAFGEDRSRWTSARELQCYCGIAPVTRQSGRTRLVMRRRHGPNFLRQTFHEWAAESWKHSIWAGAFYRYHKSRGKPFHTIVRMLAYKWIKILTRAWLDRQPYDENRYLKSLQRSGSPICQYVG